MNSAALQIAIDGPAASGKTTVARLLADRLHVPYFDTGVMYRALAYEALQRHADPADAVALRRLLTARPFSVAPRDGSPSSFALFAADGEEFTDAMLQSRDVTAIVSTVAAHPAVREAMVTAQRRVAHERSLVMVGRDIGTVVLPDAAVKVFLTASVAARAARRARQLERSGQAFDDAQLMRDIERRDRLDETRTASPLETAPGAHVIDSSNASAEQVAERIAAIAAAENSAP